MLNVFITAFDFYLYFTNFETATKDSLSDFLTCLLGGVMSSVQIIYLILLPIYIAKEHSEEMAMMGNFQRVSYTGTIVGVVMALCAVGKYLFSDNLATLLDYWTRNDANSVWSDLITSLL